MLEEVKQTDLVTYKPDSSRPIYLFSSSVLIYIVTQLFYQPNFIFSGGLWAEAATNYFANGSSSDWRVKLFATDSGYIPLPQRIISLVVDVMGVPYGSIPYVYTFTAIALSGILVAIFCLKPFRALIQNDWNRFVIVLVVLAFSEWGVRTYINFTYYGVFTLVVIAALGLSSYSKEMRVPIYFWPLLILALSKPAFLALTPLFLTLVFCKNRLRSWRVFGAIFTSLAIVQLVRLIVSRQAGVFDRGAVFSFKSMVTDTIQYVLGVPGSLVFGISPKPQDLIIILTCGLLLLALSVLVFLRRELNSSILLLCGWVTLVGSVTLNAFTLFDSWNTTGVPANNVSVSNHSLGAYYSGLIIIFGLVYVGIQELQKIPLFKMTKKLQTVVFPTFFALVTLLWLVSSGWVTYLSGVSREPTWPVSGNTKWEESYSQINNPNYEACIPIDPYGWVYSTSCMNITGMNTRGDSIAREAGSGSTLLLPPELTSDMNLKSIAVATRPGTTASTLVRLNLEVLTKQGGLIRTSGQANIPLTGGIVQITFSPSISASEIQRITVTPDTNVIFTGTETHEGLRLVGLWLVDK